MENQFSTDYQRRRHGPSRDAGRTSRGSAMGPRGAANGVTNFETNIFKFRWFLGPSDQNELYHTPLFYKIWGLGVTNLFLGRFLLGKVRVSCDCSHLVDYFQTSSKIATKRINTRGDRSVYDKALVGCYVRFPLQQKQVLVIDDFLVVWLYLVWNKLISSFPCGFFLPGNQFQLVQTHSNRDWVVAVRCLDNFSLFNFR